MYDITVLNIINKAHKSQQFFAMQSFIDVFAQGVSAYITQYVLKSRTFLLAFACLESETRAHSQPTICTIRFLKTTNKHFEKYSFATAISARQRCSTH